MDRGDLGKSAEEQSWWVRGKGVGKASEVGSRWGVKSRVPVCVVGVREEAVKEAGGHALGQGRVFWWW